MRVMQYTDRGLILPVETKVAGKYKIQVYRPDGRCRHDTGWFDNLVTDAGLNLMGTGGYFDSVRVGSGTAAPAVTDTGLASFVAKTTNVEETTNNAQSTAPYYVSTTRRWRFGVGDAEGNLSEVGVGGADETSEPLFSRALITDSNGDPTTITVLADEFLDVTYQIQSVPPTSDSTFDVTDSGPAETIHAVTLRASEVTSYNSGTTFGWTTPSGSSVKLVSVAERGVKAYSGNIGAITERPDGSSESAGSLSDASYSNNSLERTGSGTFGLEDANFSGDIKSFLIQWKGGGGAWQAELDPVIPKTNTETLSINVKTSWTRTTAL